MSFASDIARFRATVEARADHLLARVAERSLESIREGSPITGAPGQPVGEGPHAGKLRDSWELSYPEPGVAEIVTRLDYARDVEDNERGVHFHSHGPHSLKLTVAGFRQIVAHELQALRT